MPDIRAVVRSEYATADCRYTHAVAAAHCDSNEAVKRFVREAIVKAHDAGIKIGICGQAPSNDCRAREAVAAL